MYSIVKDQQNEYMSVEQPDFSTLMKLTDSCKGNRTDTQFERKAALSVSFLTKVRNGKKKRGFSLDEITKIVESQRSSGHLDNMDNVHFREVQIPFYENPFYPFFPA